MQKVAFFDADETVVNMKTMFDFMEYFFVNRDADNGKSTFERVHRRFRHMADSGIPREQINREFYRAFAGEAMSDIRDVARNWYRDRWEDDEHALIGKTVREIRRLQSDGYEIALVSGSFREVLAPFADLLGIRHILCADLGICWGVATGELCGEPVIGQGKEQAVNQFLACHNVAAAACRAYGDNISDAPMLAAVGTAQIVNPDPKLRDLARDRGWKELID